MVPLTRIHSDPVPTNSMMQIWPAAVAATDPICVVRSPLRNVLPSVSVAAAVAFTVMRKRRPSTGGQFGASDQVLLALSVRFTPSRPAVSLIVVPPLRAKGRIRPLGCTPRMSMVQTASVGGLMPSQKKVSGLTKPCGLVVLMLFLLLNILL